MTGNTNMEKERESERKDDMYIYLRGMKREE